jgi:protein SCO1/2
MGRTMKRPAIAGAITLFMIAAGCQPKTKEYSLRGQVLAKNEAANELTVKHEDIPGFMPAMTMPYKVKDPGAVHEVQPGDAIVADLIAANQGKDFWLEGIRIIDVSGRKTAKPAATRHILKVGEPVPDLELINQDGVPFHFSDFKGKAVLATFIYTRCPMPAFCPRLSSQFAKIHEALAKTPEDYSRTHLLTISFDPKYDTAPVLRRYGLAYLDNHAEGFSHWDFASANQVDMRKLADAFGLEYFEEDNQISHTMDIVLVAPDGTVAKYWATEWTAAELEEALRREARSAPADASQSHHGVKG